MPIERVKSRVAATRLAAAARALLDASTLCAIATVGPNGRPHVNTAYFAWSPKFDLVWLSEPGARHSRNIRANPSAAVAVFDSGQTWGQPDRGLQVFGTAREVEDAGAGEPERVYAARFSDYRPADLGAYRFYVLRPRRLKLFDERRFGPGVFVTARVARDGRVSWERTEVSRPT